VLKVCLNGARRAGAPMTPADCAAAAAACVALGAGAVHVHPRDHAGRERLDAAVIASTVTAIREACPGVPVGVSTREPIEPSLTRRLAAISEWTVRPDFASVNVHEAGSERVAEALRARGVGVEAGIWTADAARAWPRWRVPVVRVLLECMDKTVAEALANARAMLEIVGDGDGAGAPVLLHGEGPATWHVLEEAVRRGLDTRIGLEDVRVMPDGSPAADNAAMVAAAVRLGAR
jgi:uncharacterized protein (DUF849 family)